MIERGTLVRLVDVLTAFGVLVAAGCVWLAFERQMCANAGRGGCAPNIVYLGAALFAVLSAAILFVVRRRVAE